MAGGTLTATGLTTFIHTIHATAVLVEGSPRWLLGCTLDQPFSDDVFRSLL